MTFARAVANVLKNEGGLVDNPNDPGGLTNFGISQKAYPNLNIRELTQQQASLLYEANYWAPIHGDELPDPVSFALLDFAVDSGPGTAIKALQTSLRLPADGIIGPQTIGACGRPEAVAALSAARIYLLTSLPEWEEFGHGWTMRVIDTAIGAFQTS
jgi:lysozyme family protein